MSLRLLKILAPAESRDEVLAVLDSHEAGPRWCTEISGDRVAIDVVLRAAGNEPVLDDLESRFPGDDRFRLLFFPLEATVPRMAEKGDRDDDDDRAPGPQDFEAPPHPAVDEKEGPAGRSGAEPEDVRRRRRFFLRNRGKGVGSRRVASRINREELYTEITGLSRANWYFMSMAMLSSVVATAGLLLGDGAVIIGAMVIAPLIGPSMGTALATTLGDLKLGRSTVVASVYGAMGALGVAFLAGLILEVDPTGSEILGRTRLTFEHLALALAAGAAGALSITQGKGAGLVGVMVAVALLPPLATAGLLLGDGHLTLGIGAVVLVIGNVVSVNLAATITFLLLGVRPNTWWESGIRKKAVWTASTAWGLMLLILLAIVWLAWGGEAPSL